MQSHSSYCERSEPATVAAAARELLAGSQDMLMVLVAEGEAPPLEQLVDGLAQLEGCTFFGGIFPELLVAGRRAKRGALLVRLPAHAAPLVIPKLDEAEDALAQLAQALPEGSESATLVMLVDGLTPAISKLLEATYDELGDRVSYWGGGAGVSSFERVPCLFTRDGVMKDAAVLGLSSLRAELGVRHGWEMIEGPFVVTRSKSNVVHELNWKPALEVYTKHVGAHVGRELEPSQLGEIWGSYPLGLQKQDQELVVRDPVGSGAGGSLLCVGDVPTNAALCLLHGEPETLVAAAEAAARDAAQTGPEQVRLCLIADCISRVLFMGEGFSKELDAISTGLGELAKARAPIGVLTLGEISSRGDGYLEFFNKTCVVAALHEH